jgi:hypothetical protein
MKRSRYAIVLTAALLAGTVSVLDADVRTDQKTKFQLGGALGRIVNMFGGRGAREGVTTMVAVKGNRMASMTDSSGQIIDLAEEKVYDVDLKKKSYRVTTFAEIRRQFEEAQRKAQEEARKEQARQEKEEKAPPAERDPNAKQYDIDFDVKNTNERKNINGFDTKQSIVTVTVREKGKTLQQSGGLVMTTDMWLAPANPAMKELADFQLKYAQKVYGSMMTANGASAQEMAQALAAYPQIKEAMARMQSEGKRIEGTPIMTTMTVDAVKSADQMAEEAKAGNNSGGGTPTSVGGILGGLARRRAQNNNNDAPKDRANVFTTTSEVLKLTTDVTADAVAIPAGFKENK